MPNAMRPTRKRSPPSGYGRPTVQQLELFPRPVHCSLMRDRIMAYVRAWERRGFPGGIPDEADARLESMNKAPSYRAIVKAVLRNDVALVSLGYSRPRTPAYMALKRIELEQRRAER